jgi:hypothetical protein
MHASSKIIIKWDPQRAAQLVRRGDEVSEIVWLDDRTAQCVANEQIDFGGATETNRPAIAVQPNWRQLSDIVNEWVERRGAS